MEYITIISQEAITEALVLDLKMVFGNGRTKNE